MRRIEAAAPPTPDRTTALCDQARADLPINHLSGQASQGRPVESPAVMSASAPTEPAAVVADPRRGPGRRRGKRAIRRPSTPPTRPPTAVGTAASVPGATPLPI